LFFVREREFDSPALSPDTDEPRTVGEEEGHGGKIRRHILIEKRRLMVHFENFLSCEDEKVPNYTLCSWVGEFAEEPGFSWEIRALLVRANLTPYPCA